MIKKQFEEITAKEEGALKAHLRERLQAHQEYWGPLHKQAKEDLCFESGEQWPEDEGHASGSMKHIVKNEIRRYTNRLVNPIIQNPFSVDLEPEESLLAPITATLTDETNRFITKDRARAAYETAYRSAVISGYGAFKVDIEKGRYGKYPCLKEIQDVTSLVIDPYCSTVDGSDMEDAAILTWLDGRSARRKYGEEATVQGEWSESMYAGWSRPSLDSIPELIYYQKKYRTTRTSSPGVDGTTDLQTDTETYIEIFKFVGDLLVDRTTLDIPMIPIVLVMGDVKYSKKGVSRSGIVELARTSQKLINFYASGELDLSAVPPRPIWLMPIGADEGVEDVWDRINTERYSRVPYKALDEATGAALPPPSYQARMLDTSSYVAGRTKSEQDLETEIGISANSFGQEEHAGQSGRSVFLRQMKGEIATSHYQTNLEKSIKHAACIVIEILSILSTKEVRIVDKEAGIDETSPLNSFDFSSADFEITLLEGPLNESRKQYGLSQLMEIGEKIGFAAFADLIVASLPGVPNAEKVAERLYKLLPPELQDKEEEDAPDPEAIKALEEARVALDEAEGTAQMLWDYVQQLQGELISQREDRDSKEALEQMKIQKDLNIAQIRAEVDMYKADLTAMKDGASAPSRPDTQEQVDDASLAVDEIVMGRDIQDASADASIQEGMLASPEETGEMMDPEAVAAPETMYPITEGPVTQDIPSSDDLDASIDGVDEIDFT